MTSPNKPGVAFWATVAVVVALAYPLSFGPACWACSKSNDNAIWEKVDLLYRPMIWAWYSGPPSINAAIMWFANVGSARGIYLNERQDKSLYIRPF
jgi:hypothetical protein